MKNIRTIAWQGNQIKIIDQTKLPSRLEYLAIKDIKALWKAIKVLKVRGAPALGAAAALGVYLGVKDAKTDNAAVLRRYCDRVMRYLASCRPTARNLFWGLDRMRKVLDASQGLSVLRIKQALLAEARRIIEEDRAACRSIGRYGARLFKSGDSILTVCNAGILATIDYGTALGVIYRLVQEGKKISVYSCETRPLLQGARLTTWELTRGGIDVTMICDNMAATLMSQGKVTKVIAGADRIAANGDAANKIGTYSLAVLAKYHRIPFYIAAPASTFDLRIKTGRQIPIEERPAAEVTELFFKKRIAPAGIKVCNPAFDVTPAGLITAIITDKGVIRPPYERHIARVLGRHR
ncbi:MAG TPA: S-methyl-5-thioribose-1-phosphate isomerase [Patescibacteria group bacterium]|nr:S-methyl-5-thioribose-1-phosphate isomerase [Patescibacteria group bacterium]